MEVDQVVAVYVLPQPPCQCRRVGEFAHGSERRREAGKEPDRRLRELGLGAKRHVELSGAVVVRGREFGLNVGLG